MQHIFPNPKRAAILSQQRLDRARAIIRRGTAASLPAVIMIACRTLIDLSPHSYERFAAREALESINRRAA